MKSMYSTKELETLAVNALRALLRQVSAIELRDMKLESKAAGSQIDILANVGVYGQSHTLACKVTTSGDPNRIRKALRKLHDGAAHLAGGEATPVFIAPYLSAEAQAICAESKTGFLDLENNARLMVGEVFIGKRSMGNRSLRRPSAAPRRVAEGTVESRLPAARAEAPVDASRAQRISFAA
ncbi:MAG: hypothetical protein ACRD27_10095 [Terracidiphilus sp.]